MNVLIDRDVADECDCFEHDVARESERLAGVIWDGLMEHLAWCRTMGKPGIVFNDSQSDLIRALNDA